MISIQQLLQQKIDDALACSLSALGHADGAEVATESLQIVPCAHPQFGDYQWNGALPLAKALKTNPRALAQQVIENLNVETISAPPEIAGPGFLNFRLKREFLEETLHKVLADERQGVPQAETPRTVVIDFSAPNVAKPMHVGHIRSTIIGDSIARLLRFVGHEVIADNHIGDWGTQFGKMILGWKNFRDDENLQRDPIGEMERLYKLVNAQSETDADVAESARRETAKLQNGDEENRAIWEKLRELSQQQFDEVYGLLDIHFDVTLGESFYNDRLVPMVEELKQRGLAIESQGATIIAFEAPPHLADKPMLVQKSDGSALYGTTDLATIQYRVETWSPNEILYVVDARQALHLQQVFEAARLWGYTDVAMKHISFGTVLGEDGTPIKTRSGESVKLLDLLKEAQRRALEIVREKNPDLSGEQQQQAARAIGIGAIKYADLAQNRSSDYVFSWDKMLAMQGNTAPYLLYAYVRIRSIFRRAASGDFSASTLSAPDVSASSFHLEHEAEIDLAKFLLRFPLAIETALHDYRLNALTDYLFELAGKFNVFFEHCPVLKSDEPLRSSRLQLCGLTADVLRRGLNLLGIETVEQM